MYSELNQLTESKYAIRTFKEGDESKVVSLFNKEYGKYGGFPTKTVEYWRWSYLQRPDVEPEGILIAQDEKEVVGYAVLGKSGNIWEFCYDSEKDEEEIISLLLNSAISYLNKVNAPSISLNAPASGILLNRQCRKLGFSSYSSPLVCLSVSDYQKLLTLIMTSKHLEKQINDKITIKLRSNQSPAQNPLVLTVIDGKVQVSSVINDNIDDGTCLETDKLTFSCLIFGLLSPSKSFMLSKLKIRPFWKFYGVLRFLSSIQLKLDWYLQLGDYG